MVAMFTLYNTTLLTRSRQLAGRHRCLSYLEPRTRPATTRDPVVSRIVRLVPSVMSTAIGLSRGALRCRRRSSWPSRLAGHQMGLSEASGRVPICKAPQARRYYVRASRRTFLPSS